MEDLVAANRILYRQGVLDGFGHVSVRHPGQPDRFLMSGAKAPGRVSADDIIDMTDAKVPRTVIKAVLDEADVRGEGRPVERRSTVYVAPAPYYGYYGPAYYDPWFYDPYWYGYPRFSVGIGLGFGRFHGGGGHFRRH